MKVTVSVKVLEIMGILCFLRIIGFILLIAFRDYMTIVVRILVVSLYTIAIAILGFRLW